MKRNELRKIIKETINKYMPKKINWVYPVYNGKGSNRRLYKLEVYLSDSTKKDYKSLEDFSKDFNIEFPPYTTYNEFQKIVNNIYPDIQIEDEEFDVS